MLQDSPQLKRPTDPVVNSRATSATSSRDGAMLQDGARTNRFNGTGKDNPPEGTPISRKLEESPIGDLAPKIRSLLDRYVAWPIIVAARTIAVVAALIIWFVVVGPV